MSVNSVTPDLMVEDIEATVEWYERVFGAEVVATLPTDPEKEFFWAQVTIDGTPLMFQERESLEEKLPVLAGASIGGSVPLYVDIEDAEQRHSDLEAAGVEIVKPPHETDFGWKQFAATDCNGYVLWFGEKLETDRTENIGQYERTYHRHPVEESAGQQSVERRSPSTTENDHWG
jgi:uncharacterized glyoxalase superfamily protein PhnB